MSDDILTRDTNGDLAVRTVSSTGDNYVNKDDVYTRDNDGNLCVRVTGEGGGGGDQHNLGYYATPTALRTAYPTAEDGDFAIVGSTDTVWVWDSDTTDWVDTDQKGQVTSVNNKTGAVVLTAKDVDALPQFDSMPAASSTNSGDIVQYTGTTNASYTNGYFYKNVATTTPSSATATQTTGSSLSDISVVVATFEQEISTGGSYVFTYDGADWTLGGEIVDLTDYGITFTGTAVTDDAITVVYTEASISYEWTRIDVQPAPNPLPSQTGNAGKFLITNGATASWGNTISQSEIIIEDPVTYSVGKLAFTNIDGYVKFSILDSNDYGLYLGGTEILPRVPPFYSGSLSLGNSNNKWGIVYTTKINNGSDITVPNVAGTMTVQASTMPIAASTNEGQIVQFTGTTDANYTHGYIYECKAQGTTPETYAWDRVDAQPGGLVNKSTGYNSVSVEGYGMGLATTTSEATTVGVYAEAQSDSVVVIGSNATTASNINPVDMIMTGGQCVIVGNSGFVSGFGGVGLGAGCNASGKKGIAIGYRAETQAANAIQLGGTDPDVSTTGWANSDANTFKVGNANGNFEMMDANGRIPAARHADTTSATQGQVLTLDSNLKPIWAAGGGGGSSTSTTATLAVADWSSNTQTVNVTGVTATNNVIVSAAPASQVDYTVAGIQCTAQGAGTLTFTCVGVPSNAITVNVLIM